MWGGRPWGGSIWETKHEVQSDIGEHLKKKCSYLRYIVFLERFSSIIYILRLIVFFVVMYSQRDVNSRAWKRDQTPHWRKEKMFTHRRTVRPLTKGTVLQNPIDK